MKHEFYLSFRFAVRFAETAEKQQRRRTGEPGSRDTLQLLHFVGFAGSPEGFGERCQTGGSPTFTHSYRSVNGEPENKEMRWHENTTPTT